MTDSTEPREGWYLANKGDKHVCVERTTTGWRGFLGELPNGWTLGPRIDDLLRDAARYRWCRENITCWYVGEVNEDSTAETPELFDKAIDTEIVREEEER